MYCPSCGSEMKEGINFCGKCGQPIGDPQACVEPDVDSTSTPPSKNNAVRTKIIVAIVVVAVIAACSLGGLFWKSYQDNHAIRYAQITVRSEQLTPDFTPVPFHISGSDADGKAIDQLVFADMSNVNNGTVTTAIPLAPGDYEITIPAPIIAPPTAEGSAPAVITPGENSIALNVSADSTDPDDSVQPSTEFEDLKPLADLAELTDEQIEQIFKYAEESGYDIERLTQMKQQLLDARTQAIAEAEERRRQEEEARRQAELKAKYHIQTDYYQFDIPEQWYDKVTWETDSSGTTIVHPSAYPDQTLISVTVEPSSSMMQGGDIGSGVIKSAEGTKGMRAELHRNNWTYNAGFFLPNNKLPRNELQHIVDLSSGTSNDLDDLAAKFKAGTKSGTMVGLSGTDDFIKANIIPTFTAF